KLSLAADAHVRLVVLRDLHQEILKPGAEATIRRKGCEPAEAVGKREDEMLMPFVRIPKGTFYKGWRRIALDGGRVDAKEGVKTTIPEDFELAVHPVTQGQWEALMHYNPSWFARLGSGHRVVTKVSDEELKLFPVENVTVGDAEVFIDRLNK